MHTALKHSEAKGTSHTRFLVDGTIRETSKVFVSFNCVQSVSVFHISIYSISIYTERESDALDLYL